MVTSDTAGGVRGAGLESPMPLGLYQLDTADLRQIGDIPRGAESVSSAGHSTATSAVKCERSVDPRSLLYRDTEGDVTCYNECVKVPATFSDHM